MSTRIEDKPYEHLHDVEAHDHGQPWPGWRQTLDELRRADGPEAEQPPVAYAFQSCVDRHCDRPWDDHTDKEQQRCSALAELDALHDPDDEAQLRDAWTTEPEWARVETARREQRLAELRAVLTPTADAAEQEAER